MPWPRPVSAARDARHRRPRRWQAGCDAKENYSLLPHDRRAASRAESAASSPRPFERLDLVEAHPHDGSDDELRDPRAPDNLERFGAEIDEQHLDFPTIIRIDRARRIEHGDAEFERESRARPDLSFIALRQFDFDPGRHEITGARLDDDFGVATDRGKEIEARRARALIGRQRQPFGMGETSDGNSEAHRFGSRRRSASRSTRRLATRFLSSRGQSSMPAALTR